MENRYLFRGISKEKNEFVHGFFFTTTKGGWLDPIENESCIQTYKVCENGEIILSEIYEARPETIGQCSGLPAAKSYRGESELDRLVFEGDICKSIDGIFYIRWDEVKKSFVMQFIDYPKESLYLEEFLDDSEIIGTIHTHPELLEVSK